ncbi:unnamed protein product [Paramecium primaurelia]|uniref:Alpha-type protein kinase domain-containing protein n=1 Tax=Paramecium primaurelia TaxID=5886 RepID=A0A8S1JWF6_PARPR|nr:unnamed protein product [Paramecium primaurelia]
MIYLSKINELCIDNIQCKNEVCNLLHPRCFAGLCIQHLQKKQDDCNDSLLHFSNKECKAYLQSGKINGVYSFNLCKKQNLCQGKQDCRFLHRKWAENICIEDLIDECKNKQECQLKHLIWQEIKKEAYQEFNIFDLNPEEIENGKNHKLPNDICLQYLSGLCQFQTSCQNNHIEWECLKNSNFKDIKDTRRRQCIYDQSTQLIDQSSKMMNQEIVNQYFEKIQYNRMKKIVLKAQVIDVLFIIDNTGSMQRWLKSAKENICQIIHEFQTQLDKKKHIVRTAIVAYRDYDDEDNLLYREFTTEPKVTLEFLKKLQAKGGGDDPENVIGALVKGIRLNISKDEDSVLCTFLICDSPSHGPYHENLKDDHFDKVQEGDLENIMKKYFELKVNNFFTCLKLTENTNLMFNKMKSAFPSLIITKTTPDSFHESVLFSLRTSLKQSEAKTSKTKKTIKIKAKFSKYKPLEINNSLLRDNNIDYWQNFLEQEKNNKIEGDTLLIINKYQEILEEKDKGAECVIYKLFDIVLNRNLVLKLPKYIVNEYNQKQTISQENLKSYQQFIKIRYTSLLIAQQLAEGFRLKTLSIKGAPPIFYVSPIIYELEEPFMGVNQIFAETYINLPNFQEWKKYTNNAKFVDQDEYYYTAFSHYSYVATEGKLIITDLQGKNNILSDPTIHTIDQKIREILNDDSNFQQEGLIYFFEQQHSKCHEICKQLNLKRYSYSQQQQQFIPDNQEDSSNILVWKRDPQDSISVICQICGEFKDLTYEDYFKENSCVCNNCLEDEEPIHLICICCRKQFKCFYNQEVKIGKIPEKCEQCKLKCVQGNLECLYCGCYCEKRVNKIKIQDQEIKICNEGIRFLNSLTCSKCKQLYNFELFITPNDYQYAIYFCTKCKLLT